MMLTSFQAILYSNGVKINDRDNIDNIKEKFNKSLDGAYFLNSIYYRDLLNDLIKLIKEVTSKFNKIFGENIFSINNFQNR